MKPEVRLLSGVRAVVFDAVGTLILPDPSASVTYALVGRKFGSQLTPEAITLRFLEAFAREEEVDRQRGWRTSEVREQERWRQIVGRVLDDVSDPESCFRELFDHFSRPAAWRCDPEAAPLLAALKNGGFSLGLASNYDRRLRSVAAGLSPLNLFQHLIISSEVGWRKPAPEFFAALCRRLDLPAEKILYVGDDLLNDYEGARAAGLQAVLFDPQEKQRVAPVRRIGRLADLQSVG